MNILLITAYFPPELGSAPNLFYQLGGALAGRGHRVSVLTGFPTYNVEAANLSELYRTRSMMTEQIGGMSVYRTRTVGLPRQIPVLRGISQIAMMWSFYRSGLRNAMSFDVALVYSPPLFLGLTALWLRRRFVGRVVVNVQDLFPQSAIDLGVLRSKLLIRLFRYIERTIYRRADAITVHSRGNQGHVIRHGGMTERVIEVQNLVDTKAIRPGPRMNAFRKRYEIPQQVTVISFAGVIGLSQDLDVVIDAAHVLSKVPKLLFLIVGDGVEKPRLMKRAEGMSNIRFLPMLQQGEYTELLHASDIGLATLRSDVRTPVVPSKILSIMAAGRPIVAAMPLEGDAPKLIAEASCGVCVAPGDAQAMAKEIRLLAAQPAKGRKMGSRGRAYVTDHCSLDAVAVHYETMFARLVNDSQKKEG